MDEQILAELVAIKRLLISAMMNSGAKQDDVAKALGIDRSQISRMFADKKAKKGRGKGR
jgi:predicted transcriptional regulator